MFNQSLDGRRGTQAMLKLFNDIEGKPTRSELNLSPAFTTDPQAEVLVLGNIEHKYILGYACNS